METQIENGNFTRIHNNILDSLVKTPLLGSEYQIVFFIIRKTYGFKKTDDIISLSQFQKETGLSRVSIIKAIKNLVAKDIIVKTPILPSKDTYTRPMFSYKFNKYAENWKVVKTPILVKYNDTTGKLNASKVVKTPIHTKEITKEITKDRGDTPTQKIEKLENEESTPKEKILDFLNNPKTQELVIAKLVEQRKLDKYFVESKVKEFIDYWTEPNKTGTKVKWELRETFDVSRRLNRWFDNINNNQTNNQFTKKSPTEMVVHSTRDI